MFATTPLTAVLRDTLQQKLMCARSWAFSSIPKGDLIFFAKQRKVALSKCAFCHLGLSLEFAAWLFCPREHVCLSRILFPNPHHEWISMISQCSPLEGLACKQCPLVISQLGISVSVVAPTSHVYNRHVDFAEYGSCTCLSFWARGFHVLFSSTHCGLHVFYLTA